MPTRRNVLRAALAPALAAGRSPGAPGPVRKIVYGCYPARFGTWETSSIEWDALTHICFRSVVIRGDGSLDRVSGNPPRAFVDLAHKHDVKVSVLVWANTRQDSDSYLAGHSRQAAENLSAYVRENGLDGICYDDEQPRRDNSAIHAPSRPLLSTFFRHLHDLFHGGANHHICYASPPVISSRDRYGTDWIDWETAGACCDFIFPMLYTANPPSAGWTGNPEPLAGGGSTQATVPRDVATLMADYIGALGGRKEKLLAGINSFPFRGYEFRCRTARRLSPILERGSQQTFDYLEARAKRYGKRWDYKQQSAWYVYRDGAHYVQGWYDDPQSWSAKLDYVNQEELGGAGMWVIDGARDQPAMWEMLRTAFAEPGNA